MERGRSTRAQFTHWASGGIAGCVAKSCVAPLDRVKILFQTRNQHYIHDGKIGVVRTLRAIYKEEGVIGLWRGNSATLFRVFPYASFQFLAYENYKRILLPNASTSKPQPLMHLLCGSLAGTTATLLTYPLDLVRARMASQVHNRVYRNVWHALVHLRQTEGTKAWFKGLVPTIEGIIPYAGVNFSTFETLKHYAPKDENGNLSTQWRLICGGIAGPTGQTVSYPWDVVRRRKQTWGFAPGTSDMGKISTTEAFRLIVRTEGFFGLWRGISINYMKATPTTAIAFTVYETLSVFFKKYA